MWPLPTHPHLVGGATWGEGDDLGFVTEPRIRAGQLGASPPPRLGRGSGKPAPSVLHPPVACRWRAGFWESPGNQEAGWVLRPQSHPSPCWGGASGQWLVEGVASGCPPANLSPQKATVPPGGSGGAPGLSPGRSQPQPSSRASVSLCVSACSLTSEGGHWPRQPRGQSTQQVATEPPPHVEALACTALMRGTPIPHSESACRRQTQTHKRDTETVRQAHLPPTVWGAHSPHTHTLPAVLGPW